MALHRGIQSAIFYYLSCAPCTEARTRRKRRQEAELLRQEKETLAARDQETGLNQYAHPAPSTTNSAWALEIAIGPSKESKAAHRQSKSKAKDTPRRSSSSLTKSDRRPSKPSGTTELALDDRVRWAESFQRHRSPPTKSSTFPPERPYSGLSPLSESRHELDLKSSRTSSRNYISPNTSDSGATIVDIQKPSPTKLASNPVSSPSWRKQSHADINDLHPATVTKYDSPEQVSWMTAPPPSAKVMRGHETERLHHLSPPRRASTLRSRRSVGTDRQVSVGATAAPLPGDVLGLGIGLEDEESVALESIESDDDYAMEKHDSASPQPNMEEIGDFLFPPSKWAGDRKDSARDDGGPEHRGSGDGKGLETFGYEKRWRWSIS